MRIHLVSGFLGSGKTTAIQYAFGALFQQGIKTGAIIYDQGIKLVDGDFFKVLIYQTGRFAQLIAVSIKEEEMQSGCKIMVNSLSAFQPGYPHPVYRI